MKAEPTAFRSGLNRSTAHKVILDMDPGIDDALALLLALCSPELQVVAITTVAGNGPIEMTSTNALRVLEHVGAKDVPVARGAERPLMRSLVHALDYHGPDALAQCGLPSPTMELCQVSAGELLAQAVRRAPGETTVVATGPLTNLALAFEGWPELPRQISRLVIMGGAYGLTPYGDRGNQTPAAEFNIWEDPEAARAVFACGVDITAVGLDVTTDPATCLERQHLERLVGGQTQAAGLAAGLAGYAVEHYGRCEVHDAVALAVLLDPSLFDLVSVGVDIVAEDGPERGRTRILSPEMAEQTPKVRVAAAVDSHRFLELFVSRLLRGVR